MEVNSITGPPPHRRIHAGYGHPVLQAWHQDDEAKEEIKSMPGQYRWGVARLPEALDVYVKQGLSSVLLFGVVTNDEDKDEHASKADTSDACVVRAIKLLRKRYPRLLVMTDLCLCGYTSHGHCGILKADLSIDNDPSIKRLSEIAVKFAEAGAHVIAPSDMMDGRVGAIKTALAKAGYAKIPVMSYAAKFASCFYGPFRDAAKSGMKSGDRSGYQLPPGARKLAVKATLRDVEEGADFVMVKPGMPYLDIIREVRDAVDVPVAVYQVSGEFAMLYHAAAAGALPSLESAVMESFTAFKRAGATVIITYFAPAALNWIDTRDSTKIVGTAGVVGLPEDVVIEEHK